MASSPDALRLGRPRATGRDPAAGRRRDAFRLPALGASVAEARRRIRARLREWGVPDGTRDDAEMIVSELFTNAVRHTASRVVGCELRLDAGGGIVRLEVADQGQGMSEPRSREAGVDEEGGRGLLLVEVLSETWGVRGAPDGGSGRTVWAVLRVP